MEGKQGGSLMLDNDGTDLLCPSCGDKLEFDCFTYSGTMGDHVELTCDDCNLRWEVDYGVTKITKGVYDE
jgi:hypothetical protein